MFENLLQTGSIGNAALRNRMIMPAMGSAHVTMDGHVTDELIEYFAARARGGFGLVITEYTFVDPAGQANPGQLAIYSDDFIPGCRKLTGRVHAEGGKIFMQLHHAGRETMEQTTGQQPAAPSVIPCPLLGSRPRELSTEEVYDLIEKFGDGAVRAQKAGFDGVELHGAHGYMIAQFLSSYSNKRTDEFGGDITGRARFAVEIIKNIKEKCGKGFPVCVRISGEELVDGGRQIAETKAVAKLLERAGADALHISLGVYAVMPYLVPPSNVPVGFITKYAEAVKKSVKIPVITVGRINDPVLADSLIEDGIADFVSLGRGAIADAEFPLKVQENRTDEISPCVGCMTRCNGTPGVLPGDYGVSCAFNPFSGHEGSLKIEKTDAPKNVVIVGAGVGGLETAWVAAARGHHVTVLEKSEKAGGQVLPGCMPPNKTELARAVKYYLTMCKKYGAEIKYNTEATAESVLKYKPDTVILATGAAPIFPNIPNEGIRIAQANDILSGSAEMGYNNLVVGGGMVGLETAEYLRSENRGATVVEMLDKAGADMHPSIAFFVFKSLKENGVDIKTNTKVERFTVDGAVCSGKDGEIQLSGFDNVILAIGSKAYNPLEESLKDKVSELHVIGDAVKARRIAAAVEEGARIAVSI